MSIDKHINDTGYNNLVYTKSGYVIWEKNQRTGIIVHCILWDNIPFMNFLFIKEEYRNKGLAKQAIIIWENIIIHCLLVININLILPIQYGLMKPVHLKQSQVL